ncbi:Beta-amylase [Rhynchospora pubera]|uniref:Beta-amylase n=1 Tax=Rhynchospora pubera TaxID=906938 RepID=A0AAV8FF53_9POAL|nr:Beta-amylase [Rhynchospora pubera]
MALALPLSLVQPRQQAQLMTSFASSPSKIHSAAPPLRHISNSAGSSRSVNRSTILDVKPCGRSSHGTTPMSASSFCFATGATSGYIACSPDDDVYAYIPVYVMLPLGTINKNCEVSNPNRLCNDLRLLKSAGVDGVMADCWWGIVEDQQPREYRWSGYKHLFQLIKDLDLKLQVVMSFHRCGGNVGDDIAIPLPEWVREVGNTNPDIYFTDKDGNHNDECLTWGIDQEPVLLGRTALEVYADFMRSFRTEIDEFFQDGTITEVQVGLGPCGELRYPAYPMENGWTYPGIGEFQCYDKYLMRSMREAAQARCRRHWENGPQGVGTYNSRPYDTEFFQDRGEYNSKYGIFFLNWYSQILIDHADRVLMLANSIFQGTQIAAKVAGVHWWYNTYSHASELTAGFYNNIQHDGYAPIIAVLKKHGAQLNFTCVELSTSKHKEEFPEAMSDPEDLIWQVLTTSWQIGIPVACENALPCFGRDDYQRVLENAKPALKKREGKNLVRFTYLRLCPTLFEEQNFTEFKQFVKKMHGEDVFDDS